MTRYYLAASMAAQQEEGGARYHRLVARARRALKPGDELVPCDVFWRGMHDGKAGKRSRRVKRPQWWSALARLCDAFIFITAADGSTGEGVRQEHRVMHQAGHPCFWLTEDGQLIERGGYDFIPIKQDRRPDRTYTVTLADENITTSRKEASA